LLPLWNRSPSRHIGQLVLLPIPFSKHCPACGICWNSLNRAVGWLVCFLIPFDTFLKACPKVSALATSPTWSKNLFISSPLMSLSVAFTFVHAAQVVCAATRSIAAPVAMRNSSTFAMYFVKSWNNCSGSPAFRL